MSALYLNDLDPQFIKSIGFMYSNDNLPKGDSVPLQIYLEEAIKVKTGVSKDLTALVSSAFKQRRLGEYKPFINTIEESKGSNSDNELELDLFKEDLMCIVCNGMDVGARNRLLECSDCHRLYHQECHKPIVTLQDSFDTWICQDCKDKSANLGSVSEPLPETPLTPQTVQTTLIPSTTAVTTVAITAPIITTITATTTITTLTTPITSTTTTTTTTGITPPGTPITSLPPVTNPLTKTLTTLSNTTTKSTTSSRHSGNSNGSHKSSKSDKYATKSSSMSSQSSKSSMSSQKTSQASTSSGNPRSNVTPNINIISADKRIQIMKKKAAKLQEKRKHLTR